MRPRDYLQLFGLALIWGASFVLIKAGLLGGFSPATLVAFRLACSAAALWLLTRGWPSLVAGWRSYWRLGLLVGLINITLPFMLISWGETAIPSGTAAILNATSPLFTVLLANWWIGSAHEPLTLRRGLGAGLGFLGVVVVVGPAALRASADHPAALFGELAVLLAAGCYGVGAILSRRFGGSALIVGPFTTQSGALLLALPAAALWSPPTRVPTPGAFAVVAVLGVVGTALAYLLYFSLIRNVGATRTTLVTYLLPCTALIWGALLVGEAVTWNALVGLALILLGMAVINGVLVRRHKRTAAPLIQATQTSAPVVPDGRPS